MITKEDKKYLKMLDRMEPKSPCKRAKIAAIIVKNGKILVKAVNHPYKFYNLKKLGCLRTKLKIKSGTRREVGCGLCAEQYAIAEAARKGIALKGATIYISKHPCRICEGFIVETGIKRVVYQEGYPDPVPSIDILEGGKVKIEQDTESAEIKKTPKSKLHT